MNPAPSLRHLPKPSRALPLALATAASLALCGCHAPRSEPPELPIAAPAAWTQPAPEGGLDAAGLARWWERFEEPALAALVDEALRSSGDARAALARVEEARARYGAARSSLFPGVSASVSDRRSRTWDRETDERFDTERAGAYLDASWEADLFGANRQSARAAAADLAGSEERYRGALVSLAAEVAANYVSLRASEAQIEVLERSLEARAETLQLARWREESGVSSALETQQALAAVEQARATLPLRRQAATESRNLLAFLTGKPPGALDALLGGAPSALEAPPDIAVGIPAETLRQRPDVRAAALAVEAAAARLSAAERDRFPSLSLSGSIGVEALGAGELFSPQATVASALGSLTAPIFAAGRLQQAARLNEALERQALIAYETAVLNALGEVENALSAIRSYRERLGSLGRAVDAARESAEIARFQYETGESDFISLLDAERTLLSSEEARVGAQADLVIAHIQLYKALGGGWSQANLP